MRLDEDQAYRIYDRACNIFTWREHLLTTREGMELIYGTERMQRRVLHLLRRAEKKRDKRIRAKRGKSVRPIVRMTPVEFLPNGAWVWNKNFGFEINVGDDTEIYETEETLSSDSEDLYEPTDYEPITDEEDKWWERESCGDDCDSEP